MKRALAEVVGGLLLLAAGTAIGRLVERLVQDTDVVIDDERLLTLARQTSCSCTVTDEDRSLVSRVFGDAGFSSEVTFEPLPALGPCYFRFAADSFPIGIAAKDCQWQGSTALHFYNAFDPSLRRFETPSYSLYVFERDDGALACFHGALYERRGNEMRRTPALPAPETGVDGLQETDPQSPVR